MVSKSFINPQNSFIMNDHSKQDAEYLSQSMIIESKNDTDLSYKPLTNFQEVINKNEQNTHPFKDNAKKQQKH